MSAFALSTLLKNSLGSPLLAHWIARKVYQKIPAYRHFLVQQGISYLPAFHELPLTSKSSYIIASSLTELNSDQFDQCISLYCSSGSSGKQQYWPLLRSSNRFSVPAMKCFLEKIFQIHRQKTLIIVASSLGSWLGGEYFSWVFQTIAARSAYPLTIFTPGSHPEEIIKIIDRFQNYFQQIIILISPSFIALLHLKAQEMNVALPLPKLKYIVTSEYFPESLRLGLGEKVERSPQEIFMISMYASVDTGGLGVESPASIALRQLLCEYPDLAAALGMKQPLPLFFHSIALDSYLEIIDGNFCVTRWQGFPLVRYHLPDEIVFYDWQSLKRAILQSKLIPPEHPLRAAIATSNPFLSNIIAISGRCDKGLVFGGTNFSEAMLDTAIKSNALQSILTGLYRAKVHYGETHSQLIFDLELQPNQIVDDSLENYVHDQIIQTLMKLQPEFAMDWQDIYQSLAKNHDIVKLNFLSWPMLSDLRQQTIKQSPLSI